MNSDSELLPNGSFWRHQFAVSKETFIFLCAAPASVCDDHNESVIKVFYVAIVQSMPDSKVLSAHVNLKTFLANVNNEYVRIDDQ